MQTVFDLNTSVFGVIVEKGEPGPSVPFFHCEWDGDDLELWGGRWRAIVSPWPWLTKRRERARWAQKRHVASE
jgi:hypothetical protein